MIPIFKFYAPVAQLDRVPGYEPGGREFESLQARHLICPLVSDDSLLSGFLNLIVLIFACPGVLAESLVLDYADFGPQVAAHRLLGPEWWQWQAHGDSDPKTQYSIRIVVYDEGSESNVRTQYPLIPSENKDYRWIPLNQAIQYLEEEISKDTLKRTTDSLKKTRMRLRNYFNIQAEMQ